MKESKVRELNMMCPSAQRHKLGTIINNVDEAIEGFQETVLPGIIGMLDELDARLKVFEILVPSVDRVELLGTPEVGETLTLQYDFVTNGSGDAEGATVITWKKGATEEDLNETIKSGTDTSYLEYEIQVGDAEQFIACEVKPVDEEANEGDPVVSNIVEVGEAPAQ